MVSPAHTSGRRGRGDSDPGTHSHRSRGLRRMLVVGGGLVDRCGRHSLVAIELVVSDARSELVPRKTLRSMSPVTPARRPGQVCQNVHSGEPHGSQNGDRTHQITSGGPRRGSGRRSRRWGVIARIWRILGGLPHIGCQRVGLRHHQTRPGPAYPHGYTRPPAAIHAHA